MKCKCDNCEWEGQLDFDLLPHVPGLFERLDPGGIVPVGECPKCGALAYPKKSLWLSMDRHELLLKAVHSFSNKMAKENKHLRVLLRRVDVAYMNKKAELPKKLHGAIVNKIGVK